MIFASHNLVIVSPSQIGIEIKIIGNQYYDRVNSEVSYLSNFMTPQKNSFVIV